MPTLKPEDVLKNAMSLDIESLEYHACSSGTSTPMLVRQQIIQLAAVYKSLAAAYKIRGTELDRLRLPFERQLVVYVDLEGVTEAEFHKLLDQALKLGEQGFELKYNVLDRDESTEEGKGNV